MDKSKLIALDDRDVREYEIPKWGRVRLKAMSAKDRDQYEMSIAKIDLSDAEQIATLTCKMVAYCLVDDNGDRILDPANPDDIAILQSKSSKIVKYLFSEILALNALTEAEVEQIKKL